MEKTLQSISIDLRTHLLGTDFALGFGNPETRDFISRLSKELSDTMTLSTDVTPHQRLSTLRNIMVEYVKECGKEGASDGLSKCMNILIDCLHDATPGDSSSSELDRCLSVFAKLTSNLRTLNSSASVQRCVDSLWSPRQREAPLLDSSYYGGCDAFSVHVAAVCSSAAYNTDPTAYLEQNSHFPASVLDSSMEVAMSLLKHRVVDADKYYTPYVEVELTKGTKSPEGAQVDYSKAERVLLIAFRGTASINDALADSQFVQSESCEGGMHMGFRDRAVNFMTNYQQEFNCVAKFASYSRVIVSGHSLGGAVAKVVTLMLLRQGYLTSDRVKCITFGTPLVGDDRLVEFVDRQYPSVFHTFVHKDDIVPRILLLNEDAVSALGSVTSELGLYKTANQLCMDTATAMMGMLGPAVVVLGKQLVKQVLRASTDALYRPFGHYTFLRTDSGRQHMVHTTNSAAAMIFLRGIKCENYGQCFSHHKLDSGYMAYLQLHRQSSSVGDIGLQNGGPSPLARSCSDGSDQKGSGSLRIAKKSTSGNCDSSPADTSTVATVGDTPTPLSSTLPTVGTVPSTSTFPANIPATTNRIILDPNQCPPLPVPPPNPAAVHHPAGTFEGKWMCCGNSPADLGCLMTFPVRHHTGRFHKHPVNFSFVGGIVSAQLAVCAAIILSGKHISMNLVKALVVALVLGGIGALAEESWIASPVQQKRLTNIVWKADFWGGRVCLYGIMCWRALGIMSSDFVAFDTILIVCILLTRWCITTCVQGECWDCCYNSSRRSEGCVDGLHPHHDSLHCLTSPTRTR